MPSAHRAGLIVGLVLLAQAPSYAWNATGHRVIAYIAFRQLAQDPRSRDRVAAILRAHPAAGTKLWTRGGINGSDNDLNNFLNAATFPDDVRSGSSAPNTRFEDPAFKDYHCGPCHYINFAYRPPKQERGEILDEENVLSDFKKRVVVVRDVRAGDKAKAIALSWIFHQLGDIHMPLHNVARFSSKYNGPHGDRGGNLVSPFPNPRGNAVGNLHAYWDCLLASDDEIDTPEELQQVAEDLLAKFPRSRFSAEELKGTDDLKPWSLDGYQAAVERVYLPLGDLLDREGGIREQDLPATYEPNSRAYARRQIALAGYRLAAVSQAILSRADDQ